MSIQEARPPQAAALRFVGRASWIDMLGVFGLFLALRVGSEFGRLENLRTRGT